MMTKILVDNYIAIEKIKASAYKIPTDSLEFDGTFESDSIVFVLVEIDAGGKSGIGYTYADSSVAHLINNKLAPLLLKKNALAIKECWMTMHHSIRNLGSAGITSMAISAIDVGLWDLKAKILNIPLVQLLDQAHPSIPIYGSGGFPLYTSQQLQNQLEDWMESGITRFKIKVGRDENEDLSRATLARKIIGCNGELYVDANGAYTRKRALYMAEFFADLNVTWFEEPVISDDVTGLSLLRNQSPAGMEIAAGEYGYDLLYFIRMLENEAVDVLQADATRCGGITGFLGLGALCQSKAIMLSSHTAPQIHLNACGALIPLRHLEYFHDHVRIESLFFEGTVQSKNGTLSPNTSRPGMGLEFKHADAQTYKL